MSKITELPLAALPLTGDETIPLVQGGAMVRAKATELLGPLLPLMTEHPVPDFIGVPAPAAATGDYFGTEIAYVTVFPAGTVLDGLDMYLTSADTITIWAATATNVVDGKLTNTSVLTKGASITRSSGVVGAGAETFTAEDLAPLGDVSGKVLLIDSNCNFAAGPAATGIEQWAGVNPGTGLATINTGHGKLQLKVRFHHEYTYTLDYTGPELLDLIAAQPSDTAQLLALAAREYGFWPQPLSRCPVNDIPAVALGAAGAASALNGRAAGTPLVLLSDSRIAWLAGPTSQDGSGSWSSRGAWYGGGRTSQYGALEFSHTGSDLEVCVLGSFAAATDNLRVLVNGRIAAVTTVPNATGSFYYLRVTFPVAATRTIRIEGASGKYRGINVAASGEIAATGRSYPRIAVLGDSFDEATGANPMMDGEGAALVRQLGGNLILGAVGGTGGLNPGTGGKVAWTDATRLTDFTMAGVTCALGRPVAPHLGILDMSINDQGAIPAWWNGEPNYEAAIRKYVFTVLDAFFAANPDSKVAVYGPTWTTGNPQLDIFRMRDAGQEACAGYPASKVRFFDRLGPGPLLRDGARSYTATTGNTANGGFQLTNIASLAGVVGQSGVIGPGIPDGTRVLSIDSANSVTLSNAATATAAGVALTFKNDHAAHYANVQAADTTHPDPRGHKFDTLWKANQVLPWLAPGIA